MGKINSLDVLIVPSIIQKRESASMKNKFNIGDKVVPLRKTFWCTLEHSVAWEQAQEKGQQFLYVTKYEQDDCQTVVVCSADTKYGGDYFRESDLVPYIENEMGGIVVSKYNVGDRFYFNGRLFELNYYSDLDYYFTDIEKGQEVYTCHSTPDALVEAFTNDLKNGTNYLFPKEGDGFKETITQLEEVLEEVKQEKQYAKMEAERQAYIAEERKKEARGWEDRYRELQANYNDLELELERKEHSHDIAKDFLKRDAEAYLETVHCREKEFEELNEQVKRMNGMLDDMTYDLKQANRIIDALLGMHGH